MAQDDLNRVRNDLATIQSAIGLPTRWDPREVRINLLFAAAGLAAMAWALVPHSFSPLCGLFLFVVPVIDWLRMGNSGDGQFAGREFRHALLTAWLALPLIALFFLCRQIGLTPLQFLGLAIFLVGTVLFSAFLGEKQGRPFLGWAAALMIGGFLLPWEIAPVIAVFAGALAAGGLVSAALAYIAREESGSHVAG